MVQMDGLRRSSEASKNNPSTTARGATGEGGAQTSPTFEQLLHGDTSIWPSSMSPTIGKNHHDQEEDHIHNQHHLNNRKSVIAKVKEKAKKLRHSLSGKKKQGWHELQDDNPTPAWGVSLEDDDDEDPEYLGAPMYESELAPENYKETARQHPREFPVASEKHVLASSVNQRSRLGNNDNLHNQNPNPNNKTMTETVSEKLTPAYNAVSGATQSLATKIANLTVSMEETIGNNPNSAPTANPRDQLGRKAGKLGEQSTGNRGTGEKFTGGSQHNSDKGVSVREYLMHKLEPGEDERALSQVISDAMSPRKTAAISQGGAQQSSNTNMGVMEKMRGAVSSFIWTDQEQPPPSSANNSNSSSKTNPISANSSSSIPISANANSSSKNPAFTTTTTSSNSSSNPVSATTNAHSSRNPVSTNTGAKTLTHSPNVPHISTTKSANSYCHIPVSTSAREVVNEEDHGRILQTN